VTLFRVCGSMIDVIYIVDDSERADVTCTARRT